MAENKISPKVSAAAGGGGVGVALAVILAWVLAINGVEVPSEVGFAFGAVISSVLATVGGYLKRDPDRS